VRPDSFYQRMWDVYQESPPAEKRDWLHRIILDRIFDPWANNRSTVALRQLGGGHRLLDIGCWECDSRDLGRTLCPYDVTRLLTESGFKVVARNATGGRPGLRERWLSLLSGEFVMKGIRVSANSRNV
jgi:hypothetical protein